MILLALPAKPWDHGISKAGKDLRDHQVRPGLQDGLQGPAEAPLQRLQTLSALPPPSSPAEISRVVSSLSHDWIPLKTAENTCADGNKSDKKSGDTD